MILQLLKSANSETSKVVSTISHTDDAITNRSHNFLAEEYVYEKNLGTKLNPFPNYRHSLMTTIKTDSGL